MPQGRIFCLIAASAAAALAGAAPPAAACERSATGKPFTGKHRQRIAGSTLRTANVVCDRRRGVRFLLSAGTSRGARGVIVSPVSVLGPRAAWVRTVGRGGRLRATVLIADLRRRRVVRRVPVGSTAALAADGRLAVALLRDGTFAHSTWDSRPPAGSLRLVLPGGEVIGEGAFEDLASEDGTTLRWSLAGDVLTYRDVLPPPVRDGCPVRERFTTIAEQGGIRVTRARYRQPEPRTIAIYRACILGSGRDIVINVGDVDYPRTGSVTTTRVARAADGIVELVVEQRAPNLASCVGRRMVFDVRTGERLSGDGEPCAARWRRSRSRAPR